MVGNSNFLCHLDIKEVFKILNSGPQNKKFCKVADFRELCEFG